MTTTTDTIDTAPGARRGLGGPLWKPILVVLLVVLVVGGVGDQLTVLDEWYDALRQPWFKPPDWLFPIGWTIIYLFTGTSAVLAWQRAPSTALRAWLLWTHLASAAINILWSFLFFTLQRPDWSLYEVVVLWLSVAMLTVISFRCDRTAGWLMMVYLAWVTFAGTMNWAVVDLNGPFPMVSGG